jgi:hypothetical protein
MVDGYFSWPPSGEDPGMRSRIADLVVLISAGTIAQFGNHAKLMKSEGIYAESYRLFARAYRD